MNITRIPLTNLPRLEAEIAEINKKATKLGCPAVTLTIHGEEVVTTKNHMNVEHKKVFKLVSVEGEAPKLAGWTLVAIVEQLPSGENMVRCVPGETAPESFRHCATDCDHCATKRHRREVFVLRHDTGRHVQVGRNCLADFLGGVSPETVLASASYLMGLADTLKDAEDEGWGFGGGREVGYGLDEYVKTASVCIRKLGWVSRGQAHEFGGSPQATADVVNYLLSPSFGTQAREEKRRFIEKHELYPEDRDIKLAEEAIEWAKALPTDQGDYIYNLGVAIRLGFVQPKTAGLVASLISAYMKHMEREIERKKTAAKIREHVGTVKERSGFENLTVVSRKSFDGMYGVKTLVRFEDEKGSVLVWWACGDVEFEVGKVYDITGTVKEHSDYKGTPQTVLQRVIKGLPKIKKSRKVA